jgi:Glycosyl transferase family 2
MTRSEPVISNPASPAFQAPLRSAKLDQPVLDAHTGEVVLSGWIAAEPSVEWVLAAADQRRLLAKVRADHARTDVVQELSDRDGAQECGFRIRLLRTLIGPTSEIVVAAVVGSSDPIPIWSVRIGDSPAGDVADVSQRLDLSGLDTPFRVTALMSTFNEADIIEPVLEHLALNGIETYVIDNHSTDDTLDRARRWLGRGVIGTESFPAEAPDDGRVSWAAILRRKAELSRELGADWYIHHDADEIREVPWPNSTLRDAIQCVDRLGFNVIDFRLFNFPPVDDAYRPGQDPREHFIRWEGPREYDRVQRKCWKAGFPELELHDGGHDVRFPGRRIFPLRFLLFHYPVRGQTHGCRKVLVERANRFVDGEIEFGWHRQYGHVRGCDHMFLQSPGRLRPFDLERMRLETVLDSSGDSAGQLDSEQPSADDSAYRGRLERADAVWISGWAATSASDTGPLSVELWDGPNRIAAVRADRHRGDVEEAGFGDGRSGFAIRTPLELLDGRRHWIWATIEGSGWPLRRSPRILAADQDAVSAHHT